MNKKIKLEKRLLMLMGILLMLVKFAAKPVAAMHIMEGFLPVGWSIFWTIIFIPFFTMGVVEINKIIKEKRDRKVLLALSGAFIFILSALKIPSVTGSTSHPTGVGLGTVLFGPKVISVLGTISLLFQALLLAHGGITTLGANAMAMTVVGPFVGYAVYNVSKKMNLNRSVSIFLCAVTANLATYVMTSIQLGVALPDPEGGIVASIIKFLSIFMITQIPISIIEGLLSVVMVNLIDSSINVEREVAHNGY